MLREDPIKVDQPSKLSAKPVTPSIPMLRPGPTTRANPEASPHRPPSLIQQVYLARDQTAISRLSRQPISPTTAQLSSSLSRRPITTPVIDKTTSRVSRRLESPSPFAPVKLSHPVRPTPSGSPTPSRLSQQPRRAASEDGPVLSRLRPQVVVSAHDQAWRQQLRPRYPEPRPLESSPLVAAISALVKAVKPGGDETKPRGLKHDEKKPTTYNPWSGPADFGSLSFNRRKRTGG